MRFVRTIAGILLALGASIALAGDLKLADLMQMLSQQKAGRATFTEKKYIGIIDKPLVSSGELAFTAPDKLEKRTLKPAAESLVLNGDSLTIEQPNKRPLIVSLRERPEAFAFVESIRGTLAGDRLTLEKYYAITLNGSLEKWQLVLVPIQERMVKIISRIRIGGALDKVKTIDFDQADGDRSEMVITESSAK